MNNNNLRPNTPDWSTGNSFPYSGQTPENKQANQYSYQVHQPTNLNVRPEGTQQKYMPMPKAYDPDFKEKNRAMYNSSMTFGAFNQNTPSLSSFARQVNQPVGSKDTNESDKYLNANNNVKYNNFIDKYSGQVTRNPKMASSAIFPQQHASNQAQFNRFPAFNIGIGSGSQQSSGSSSGSIEIPKPNPNQTPQQRKQRQLMQIKKQLEQINKKMINNAQKNKNSNHPGGSELRPPRSAGVSQSMMLDTNTGSNYGSGGYGSDYSQPSTSKPLGMQNTSIDQLYNQKYQKSTTDMPKIAQQSYKVPINLNEQSFNQNRPVQKYTNYNIPTSNISKPLEFDKRQQQTKKVTPPLPTYDSSTYKPQNSYNKPQNQSTSYGSYNTSTASTSSNSSNYNDKPSSFTKTNNTPIVQASTYSFAKTYQEPTSATTGFKKKRQAIVYETSSDSKKSPDFLNKANYPPENLDIKKTAFYPQTSPSPSKMQHHGLGVRRTQSTNYVDFSSPLPQLKKIKLSDFAVGKKMGKGQFGQVMLVRHKETGFVCGLKVMEKKQIKDQDYVGQIARQLSIQFYLSHRNIAPLYGYFEDEKNVYLLVEFCTGGQLLQKLRGQRRMNQKDVSTIIKQVCEGVDYIHKQLIIHRDIKPENILFNFGIVKISDFGWAVYRGFGMRKTASGSPLYYPPEIVKGQEYDDKIDVWNIGMMTYECILGKIPFRVYSQLDLNRIVSDQITFPSYVDVTDEAKDFILKTMKKKGDERMQIRQMLRHPFITKHSTNDINPAILQEFRRVLE